MPPERVHSMTKECRMSSDHILATRKPRFFAFGVWLLVTMLSFPLHAETTLTGQEAFLRARHVTVGILAETHDQRMPEKPGKVVVRGTGFHLRDGYVITARHAVEKHELSTGAAIQKHIRILTN